MVNFLSNGEGNCGDFFRDPVGIVLIVLMGLLLVAMVVVPMISRRRRKAANDDLDSNMKVGDKVMTAGGIIGNIVEINETDESKEIMVETGREDNKTTILFDARGILQNLSRPPQPTNFFGMPKKNAQGDEAAEQSQEDTDLIDLEGASGTSTAAIEARAEDVFAEPASQAETEVMDFAGVKVEVPAVETTEIEAPPKPKTTRPRAAKPKPKE